MPIKLLEDLRRFAKAASYKSPDLILAEHEARQPRRQHLLWWTKS